MNNKHANVDDILKKLESIAAWFEKQKEPNIEEGLLKIEEASVLLRAGRSRFREIENRFEEIQKDVDEKQV